MEENGSRTSLRSALGRPTLDEHLNAAGLGWYQARLFAMLSLIVVADGMEMTVLTMLRAPVMRDFSIDKYEFAGVGSVIFGGMLVGSLAGGAVGDLYGRRIAMLMAGTVFCIFGLCSAIAPDLYTFAFSRVLTGFGVGAMVPVADSLLLEWSPTKWRAKIVMTMIGTAFAVGSIVACGAGLLLHQTMGGGEGSIWWRVLLVVCTLPGLVALPWMYFSLPESVHFLMANGRHEEAHELLKDLERINGTPLEMGGQITTREYAQGLNEGHSLDWKQFAEMYNPEVRGTTLYLIVTFVACGFIYYGFSFIYPHVLEKLYGITTEEAFSEILVVNCVEVASCLVFMFYMDVEGVGRRGAMLTTWVLVVLCSGAAIFVDGNRIVFQTVNLICKGAVAAAFTIVYVYAGELLPSTVRTSVISVGGCFGRIATMGAPALLTSLLDYNVDLVYGFYMGTATMALVAGIMQYRETLGEPLVVYSCDLKPKIEEMQQLSWTDRYFPILGRLKGGGGPKGGPYTPLG